MIITFKNLENFRIETDNYGNFVLHEYVDVPEINTKTGKPNKNAGLQWRSMNLYYPNPQQAIHGLIRALRTRSTDTLELVKYVEWYKSQLALLSELDEMGDV